MAWESRYLQDPALVDFVPARTIAGARVLVRRGYEGSLGAVNTALARSTADRISREQASVGGRSPHPIVALPNGERILVRRYLRGGAIRHLNRAIYFGGNRALEELTITELASSRGVRVPTIIAAIEIPGRSGYTAALASRWIPDASDLATWLCKTTIDPNAPLAALAAVGVEVRKMHAAGIAHPDLNLRNVLLTTDAATGHPTVYLIDFDKAVAFTGAVPASRCARDLRRFARSVRKLNAPMGDAEWHAMISGYGPGWPVNGRRG